MAATKFTPDRTSAFVSLTADGASVEEAARQCDIRPKTAEGWITRGRNEESGPYREFFLAVEDARHRASRKELSREEYDEHLAKAVRAGSVQAMKLWWEIHRGEDEEPPEVKDDFADLDEVAAARARKAS